MRFASLALAPLLALSALAADVCNGDASLCGKKYSAVTFIGTHNSYSVGDTLANNQAKPITDQLNDGVRALQVQSNMADGTINLCHSTCGLQNSGPFQDYLGTLAKWMESNPNEVVTLVIVNQANQDPSAYASLFEASGLANKAYKPASASLTVSEWPTLGELIDAGTPLVVFMNAKADFAQVPYIIDEFTNMWEDAYDVLEPSFACEVNRTNGQASTQLYMINHFLDKPLGSIAGIVVPNIEKLNETNAATGAGSIGFHVDNCVNKWGRNPNIILLDYYDSNGNAPFQAAAQLNGVPAPTQEVTPAAPTSAAPASGNPAGLAAGTGTGAATVSVSESSLRGTARALIAPGGVAALAAAALGVIGGAFLL